MTYNHVIMTGIRNDLSLCEARKLAYAENSCTVLLWHTMVSAVRRRVYGSSMKVIQLCVISWEELAQRGCCDLASVVVARNAVPRLWSRSCQWAQPRDLPQILSYQGASRSSLLQFNSWWLDQAHILESRLFPEHGFNWLKCYPFEQSCLHIYGIYLARDTWGILQLLHYPV